ncbi:MAG: hypothetical protein AAFQ42_07895 [Pseudomonadota bacterium]
MLEQLVTSPHIADAVMVVLAVEIAVLIALRFRGGLKLPPLSAIISNAVAALGILIALRAALAGSPWPGVPIGLSISLAGHLADLKLRLRATRNED